MEDGERLVVETGRYGSYMSCLRKGDVVYAKEYVNAADGFPFDEFEIGCVDFKNKYGADMWRELYESPGMGV